MYKIMIGNEKGGVGKTALATHLAAGLAARGKRVLLIDTDPQGHATVQWGLKKAPGLYDLLVRDAAFREVVIDLPGEKFGFVGETVPREGRLSVLPSNVETRNIANNISDVGKLGQRLEEIETFYDVVIYDTAPTPTMLHSSIYIASDGIIYPTRPEILSFDGLTESWSHRKNADGYRQSAYALPLIRVLGIVPMMVEEQTVEHSLNLARLREQFRSLVWPCISKSILWAESNAYGQPVYQLNPSHKAADQVWEVVDRVEEVIREQLSQHAAAG